MKPPLSSIMGSTRRVADAKRGHPVDANKMVCAHDPDPEQVRNLLGWRQSTRCWRCDAKLERVRLKDVSADGADYSGATMDKLTAAILRGAGALVD